ncbi:hypothetical protein [Terrisporobacter sp.]|uniref:hypothetical protein n=1 Tax=Terrisporobacter sp. TaxID=1965305 RepID=UPI002896F988|nr:hypothetical protein [Terrisporobacter sp.]
MGRKIEYYCDCCKEKVKTQGELTMIEITFGSKEGLTHREVCFDCWKEYTNEIAEVAKKLFR